MEIRNGCEIPWTLSSAICPNRVLGSLVLVNELQVLLTPEPSVRHSVCLRNACVGTCVYGQMHICVQVEAKG